MKVPVSVKIRFAVFLILILCSAHMLAEQPKTLPLLEDILPADIVGRLRNPPQHEYAGLTEINPAAVHSETNVFYKKKPELTYLPLLREYIGNIVLSLPSGENPDLIVESVYLLDRNREGRSAKEETDKISRIFRSFSTMKGIKYVSSSQKIETLYHDAYTIGDAEKKNKIPDRTEADIEGSYYFYQYDNTFKDCIYRADYKITDNTVQMNLTSVDYIKFGGIKAMKPDNLTISMTAIIADDAILIYSLVQSHFMNVPFIGKRISRSFKARTDSIFQWFADMYLGKPVSGSV